MQKLLEKLDEFLADMHTAEVSYTGYATEDTRRGETAMAAQWTLRAGLTKAMKEELEVAIRRGIQDERLHLAHMLPYYGESDE